jgi:hypothetical protein
MYLSPAVLSSQIVTINYFSQSNFSGFYHNFTHDKKSYLVSRTFITSILIRKLPLLLQLNNLFKQVPATRIMSKPSPQLTSQRNTDIIRVTSLLQNTHMYSQQIYTTTHKKIMALPNLNVLPHFGLAIWRWIIYAVSISSPYINAENTKN